MERFRWIHNTIRILCIGVLSLGLYSCGGHKRPQPPRVTGRPPSMQPYVVNGKVYYPLPSALGYREVGYASWYGRAFHGRPTASGEPYNMYRFTAAHKTLPLGTYCLVENLENGKKTVVKINDRGPFVKRRIIDLSYAAARAIGMVGPGVAKVRVTALGESTTRTRAAFKHLPDLAHGRFYVQIGAFRDKANALRLRERLLKRFKTVKIRKRWTPKGTLYGVQVYAGTYIVAARKLEKSLERTGYPDSFIVSD